MRDNLVTFLFLHGRYRLPLNADFQGTILREGAITHKGGVGSGDVVFTEQQRARWNAAEEAHYGADSQLLRFARRIRGANMPHGLVYPDVHVHVGVQDIAV